MRSARARAAGSDDHRRRAERQAVCAADPAHRLSQAGREHQRDERRGEDVEEPSPPRPTRGAQGAEDEAGQQLLVDVGPEAAHVEVRDPRAGLEVGAVAVAVEGRPEGLRVGVERPFEPVAKVEQHLPTIGRVVDQRLRDLALGPAFAPPPVVRDVGRPAHRPVGIRVGDGGHDRGPRALEGVEEGGGPPGLRVGVGLPDEHHRRGRGPDADRPRGGQAGRRRDGDQLHGREAVQLPTMRVERAGRQGGDDDDLEPLLDRLLGEPPDDGPDRLVGVRGEDDGHPGRGVQCRPSLGDKVGWSQATATARPGVLAVAAQVRASTAPFR